MSDPKLDALFEKMSKGTADKITGTHPPKRKTPCEGTGIKFV